MNPEICKKCNRTLVFVDSHEALHKPVGKMFFCCKRISFLDFEYGTLKVGAFAIKQSKWKRIKFHLCQPFYFKWSITKWINGLLKHYKIEKLKYTDFNYVCPYYIEHQIYDWSKENERRDMSKMQS